MPDTKKDVAKKLSKITGRLRKMFSYLASDDSPYRTLDRFRNGVTHRDFGDGGMNALREIFKRQIEAQFKSHKLSKKKFFPIKDGQEIVWDCHWMQLMTMWLDAMIDETEETRNWLNWKSWKKPTKITKNDIENARFELIDLLHFWLNAYYMLGGTPESLVVEYHAKRDENDNRQKESY